MSHKDEQLAKYLQASIRAAEQHLGIEEGQVALAFRAK